jgi:tetratricopeptide (TPR) repeat protein
MNKSDLINRILRGREGGQMSAVATDHWGASLQSTTEQGVALFDAALRDLVSLSGDPVAAAEAVVAADDGLVLGHVLRAYLHLYRTSADGVANARKVLEDLDGVTDLSEREVLHLRAARAWAQGQWDEATHFLERALLHDSRDLLALKVAQDLYFFLGQSKDIRGVVARVVGAWPSDRVGWGYIQGMYAFGLEENGDYERAEISARAALQKEPRDVWASHALAHVFEMQGRQSEGVTFLDSSAHYWSSSFFAVHNWWHHALFHLESNDVDRVFADYDGPIRATRSTEWFDLVDAASLLWRLSLYGYPLEDRVQPLAVDVESVLSDPVYIFNDWHAVMVFGLAGAHDLNERVLTGNRRHTSGTNRLVAEQAGLTLLEGFSSFSTGRYERALDLLSEARPFVHSIGGSHAQRDIVDLTLIAAAARAGHGSTARAFAADRVAKKPSSAAATERLLEANGL